MLADWLAKYGNLRLCRKLAGNENTNISEAVNGIILMFEGKRKFHSGETNNEIPAYLACGYKNDGAKFFLQVAKQLGTVAGPTFLKMVDELDEKREYNCALSETEECKQAVVDCKIARKKQTKDMQKEDEAENGPGGGYGTESRLHRDAPSSGGTGGGGSCSSCDGCSGGSGADTSARGGTSAAGRGDPMRLSKNGLAGACMCNGKCAMGKGKGACPCRAAKKHCTDACRCGRKTGCSNNSTNKPVARSATLADYETAVEGAEYMGELDNFVALDPELEYCVIGFDFEATGGNVSQLQHAPTAHCTAAAQCHTHTQAAHACSCSRLAAGCMLQAAGCMVQVAVDRYPPRRCLPRSPPG